MVVIREHLAWVQEQVLNRLELVDTQSPIMLCLLLLYKTPITLS